MKKHLQLLLLVVAMLLPWVTRAQDDCTPISTFPVTYGFEASEGFNTTVTSAAACTTNVFNSCWRNEETSFTATSTTTQGRIWHIYGGTTASQIHSGAHSLMLPDKGISSSLSTTMLTFPAMAFTNPGGYVVSFWIYRNGTGTSTPEGFKIYASPTDTIGPNAVEIGHYSRHRTMAYPTIESASGWYQYETAPITMTGTVYIIFEGQSYYSNSTYVDDIVIMEAPTCIKVTDLAIDATLTTTSSLTLTWTDTTNTGATYNVYMLTATDTVLVESGVSGTTYTATGLEAGTYYTFAVVTDCGVGDTSVMSHTASAYTACEALGSDDLPYTEDFEAYGSGSAYSISPCWAKGIVNSGSSSTTTAYPYPSSTAISGTRSLYFYTSHTSSYHYYNWAVLPPIDDTELTMSDLMLTFKMKRNTGTSSTSTTYTSRLIIGVTTDDTTTAGFVPVDTIDISSTNSGSINDIQVSFENYTGTGRYIMFYAPAPENTTSSNYNYFYIDDVVLRPMPTCFWPTHVTTSGVTSENATIRWTPDSRTMSPSSWSLEYGEHGFTRGEGTVLTAYDTIYTIYNLLSNTQYDVYVSANCGTDVSDASFLTFRTACEPLASLPYTETFDSVAGTTSTSASVNNLPPCWNYHNVGTSTSYSGYPIVYNSSTYAHSGSQAMRFYTYITAGTYADQYGIMPMTDSTLYPINSLMVDFWMRANSTSYNSYCVVGVMSDPNDASTFVPVQTLYTNSSTTYAHHEVYFGNYTGAHGCIAFKFPQPTSGYNYGYVDDITISELPSCPSVVSLQAEATAGAALLTWNYDHNFGGAPDSYEVTYDSIGGTSPSTETVTDPTLTLVGLEPGTQYKAYVRSSCGSTYGQYDSVVFATGVLSCLEMDPLTTDTVVLGGGTTTSYYIPIGQYYNYSYTQQIVLASEMNGATSITGIDFQYGYSTATTQKNNVTIYMANTTVSSLSSSFVPYSPAFVQVYSGPVNGTTGWNHYEFDTPFSYDGTSNLLIVVHDNSGAYPGSSYVYYCHSASGKARYVQNDGSPYDLNTVSGGTSVDTRANMKLYSGECITMASCAAPLLNMSQSVNGDVTLTWVPGYQETSWDIDIRTADTNEWTTLVSGTATTEYTISVDDLDPATDYVVRVVALCSDTNMYSTVEFTTPCVYATLPIIENFDGMTGSTATSPVPAGFLPYCWDIYNDGTRTNYQYCPYVYSNTTYAHSGSNCIRFYSYNSSGDSNQYLILPVFDSTEYQISDLQLSFWLRGNSTSTSYFANVVVGVMTDVNNESSFIPVDTVNYASTTYEYFEVNLDEYTGPHGRVTMLFPKPASSSQYEYGYVDDITLGLIPTCLMVEDLEATYIATDSILIEWIPQGEETSWEVQYNGQSVMVFDTFFYADNLSPNTVYNFVVRAVCSDGDTSYPRSVSARTACGALTQLPYIESFEGLAPGTSSNLDCGVPCWDRLDNATSYHFGYPGSISSWSSGAHTGTGFLYYYLPTTTGTYADWILTILPTIDVDVYSLSSLQVSFWVKMNSATTSGDIQVGVISDITDASTFIPLDTVHVTGNIYDLKTGYLTGFADYADTVNANRIALKFFRDPSTTTYYFLDDVTVEEIPDCPPVSNIALTRSTADSLYVTWTENGDATQWTVEYGAQGFTPGEGTTELVTTLPIAIGGLTANTPYDVYITPECYTGVAATRMGTFRTACNPMTVPFTESFDTWSSTAADPLPSCWEKHTNYSSNYPYASTSYSHTGGKSMYMYSTSTTYTYMVLPAFDLPIDSTMVSFWLYKSNTSYDHKLQVGVMSDPSDVSTFVQIAEVAPSALSTWELFEIPLTSYQGSGNRIAIMSPNGEYSYPYLDDLTVGRVSSCMRVLDLMTTNVTLDSATITWSDGLSTSWYVEYDTADFVPGTTHTPIAVYDTFYIFSGLDSATTYYAYVYPDCDTILPRLVVFSTLAASPATVPYSCDFEAAGVNGWDFIQEGQANYWMVGNATNNGGTQSMYITDNGSTNSYSGAASYSFAVRTFNLQAGNYICTYDWKCQGESSFDFLRAALVPAGVNIEAGGYCGFDNTSGMPVGSIALDGGGRLNLQGSTWQNQLTEFTLQGAGTYKLVFLWRNDPSIYNLPPVAIDNVQLMLNTCAMPDNITLDNLTQTSTDIYWEETGSASLWEYEFNNGTPVIVYDTTCTVTGLSANTVYTFRVRSICSAGDTSAWATYSFRTPCGYMTLPYVEDFENETTGSSSTGSAFVSCWTRLNNGTSYGGYPYVSSSSTYNHTVGGTKGMYWYLSTTAGTYGDYEGFVLPPLDPSVGVDSLQLSFWTKASSASYIPVFQIGVMTNPNDVTTFVGVDTITITTGTDWTQVEVPLTGYTGNGQYVAVKADRPSSAWYAYLDDVLLEYVPTCLTPRNVHSTAATTTSITLDWTDLSTASSWEVEYTGNGVTDTMIFAAHPATLNGLNPSSSYMIRVRAICTVGDTSRWSEPANAATECDLVIPPYRQDFDGVAASTYSAAGILPPCWEGYSNGTSAVYTPHVVGSGSYWYVLSGSNSLCMTSGSASYGDTKFVRLPQFATAVNTMTVSFWMSTESSSNGYLCVGYLTDSSFSSFVTVDSIHASSTTYHGSSSGTAALGYYDTVDFSAAPATAQYIAFKWVYTSSFYSCCIDDVEVTSTGTVHVCNAPVLTGETHTYQSATVNWSGTGNAYEIAMKATTAPTWPTETAVAGNTYTFTGLQPATEYTYRVRQDCTLDSAGYSDWTVGTFTTDSLPCLAPTGLTVTDITNHEATFSWTPAGNETAWELHVWTSGGLDTMVTSQSTTRTLDGFVSNVSYNAQVRALCGTDQSVEGEWSSTVQFTTIACPTVTGLQTTSVTPTSITVSWTPVQMAQGYELEYGVAGTAPGSGTIVQVSATSYTIIGLEPMQMYDIRVMALCGDNWYSEEAATLTGVQTPDIPEDNYVLTVTSNNPAWGTVTLNPAGGVYPAGTQVTLTATPTDASHYSFENWSDNVTDNPRVVTVNSDMTLQAIFAESVGIETIDGVSFVLYPNPAKNSTTVSILGMSGKVRIAVLDVNGREVLGETVECSADCEKLMDIDNLSQGAYFVRVTGEQGSIVRKLMVK